jgi:hypothetical protein
MNFVYVDEFLSMLAEWYIMVAELEPNWSMIYLLIFGLCFVVTNVVKLFVPCEMINHEYVEHVQCVRKLEMDYA